MIPLYILVVAFIVAVVKVIVSPGKQRVHAEYNRHSINRDYEQERQMREIHYYQEREFVDRITKDE